MWGRPLLLLWVIPFIALFLSPEYSSSRGQELQFWGEVLALLLTLDLVVFPIGGFRLRTRAPRSIEILGDRLVVYLGFVRPIRREVAFQQVLGVKTPPNGKLNLGGLHVLVPRDWSHLRPMERNSVSEFEATPINLYLTPHNARAVQAARNKWRKDHPTILPAATEVRNQALAVAEAQAREFPTSDGWVPNRRRDKAYPGLLWGVTTVLAVLFAFMGWLAGGLYGLSGLAYFGALIGSGSIAYGGIGAAIFIVSRKWIDAVRVEDSGLRIRSKGGVENLVPWSKVSRLLPEDSPSPDWVLTYTDRSGHQMMAVSASIAREIIQSPSCPPAIFGQRKRAATGDVDEIEEFFDSDIAAEIHGA